MDRFNSQNRSGRIARANETQRICEETDIPTVEREVHFFRIVTSEFFQKKRTGSLGGSLVDMSLVKQIATCPVRDK